MNKKAVIVAIVIVVAAGAVGAIAFYSGLFGDSATQIGRLFTSSKKVQTTNVTGTLPATSPVTSMGTKTVKTAIKSTTPKTTPIQPTSEQRAALQAMKTKMSKLPAGGQDQWLTAVSNAYMNELAGVWMTLTAYAILRTNGTYDIYEGAGDAVTQTGTWTATQNRIVFTNGETGGKSETPYEYSTTSVVPAPYNHWFGFNYWPAPGVQHGLGLCGKYSNMTDAQSYDFDYQRAACWTAYDNGWGLPDNTRMEADPVCRHHIVLDDYPWFPYPSCDVSESGFSFQ